MTHQVDRPTLIRWLTDHEFIEVTGRATSLRKFKLESVGAISVPGAGPNDLTKKHVGQILRALAGMGFDRDVTRDELETGAW